MDNYQFFWSTMELCDWRHEGDDGKVLTPVIEALSKQEDSVIFEFHNTMSELLYHLDTKKLAAQCQKADPHMSDDTFLYARCVALINGPAYYEKAKNAEQEAMWDMEFESLLYIPEKAWALKHRKTADEYPHIPPLCFETGSNLEGWKE